MLINLIIIYFACGSPIGIYRITRITHSRTPGLTAIGAYFILWPIFVPAILRRSISDKDAFTEAKLERQIENIRSEMETIAFTGFSAHKVYEFREVFDCYTGLTMSSNGNRSVNSFDALFRIAKHENRTLATACLDRRNRQRLSFHQTRARKDFIDLLGTVPRLQPNSNEIINLCLHLADLLNDKILFDFLTQINHFGGNNDRSEFRRGG